MRIIIFVACFALAGCGASRQEVAQRLGDQYIGRSVDSLVVDFGPPASTFKMNSGETAYVWQLGAVTNTYIAAHGNNAASGSSSTDFCKVNVIASMNGTVTRFSTEDRAGSTGLLSRATGADFNGSLCARRLGMRRQS